MTIIVPPFTLESATQKVRLAEDGWNSRDPEKVSLAYTPDSRWRNCSEFAKRTDRDRGVPHPKVGKGARLSADQGALGLHR